MPTIRDRDPHPLDFHLGQLRHAYAQLLQGKVVKQQEFADGLIAPVIRAIEAHIVENSVTPSSGCVFNDIAVECPEPGCKICNEETNDAL